MVIDELKKHDCFVIYGAQVIAYGAYIAIRHLTGKVPEYFIVGSMNGNPEIIDEIKVKTIDTMDKNIFILVGVTELIQKEVLPFLQQQGYENVFILTQHEEHLLMSEYYKSIGKYPLADSMEENIGHDFMLYEVKNHRDKPLSSHPKLYPWEHDIQAGAVLSDLRMAEFVDSTGINISEKNKQYCEMTATYWVWKNTEHDWTGIEHYRRHLLVRPEMLEEGVDAILPLPYLCYPNEINQFLRFTSKKVLDLLLKALYDLHPKQYNEYNSILYGQYQYTYNLICAKHEVFDDYCRWFFNITEYMENFSDIVPEITETRALSYVAEVLTNLYFMHNEKHWNIKHVEKEIYT